MLAPVSDGAAAGAPAGTARAVSGSGQAVTARIA